MSNQEGRFQRNGFMLIRAADTATHEVEIGSLQVGGETVVLHVIRKAGLRFEGDFLVAGVYSQTEKVCLWKFHKDGSDRLGLLAEANDEHVVALVGKGREGRVEEVISVSSLIDKKPLDIRKRIQLKQAAADFLKRGVNFNQIELKVIRVDHDRRQAELLIERQREAEVREREAEVRRQQRAERLQELTSRQELVVFTSDGRRRSGIPVTEAEWSILPHGKHAVLVEAFDEEVGAGLVVESFRVDKSGGKRPRKEHRMSVTLTPPGNVHARGAEAPEPVDSIVVENDTGALFEVLVYETREHIRQARAAGLNGGSYVTASECQQNDGRFEVYSVRADGVQTVGLLTPLSLG